MRKSILSDIFVFLGITPTNKIIENKAIFGGLNAMPLWHIETCGVVNITRLYLSKWHFQFFFKNF